MVVDQRRDTPLTFMETFYEGFERLFIPLKAMQTNDASGQVKQGTFVQALNYAVFAGRSNLSGTII